MTAEFAVGSYFAGDAGHLGRENAELLNHRVHDVGRPQELSFQRPPVNVKAHGLSEVALRNRRDGPVEALFVGPPDAVAAMITACHQGPRGSRVDGVDQRDGTAEELKLRRRGELFSVLASV